MLDRWADVYPQPRAVHLDDEVYRILARLGVADEFAAISRPALGLRLLDTAMRVLAEFRRDTALQPRTGFPQANMFDQPDLETLLRTNLKRLPSARVAGQRRCHRSSPTHGTGPRGHLRSTAPTAAST